MRKIKVILPLALLTLFLVVSTSFAQASRLFPAVSAGPGLFLPDSPLYALDKFSQRVKLAVAMSPDKRAEIRNGIIGERLAELRIMHAKGNSRGMSIALFEISDEAKNLTRDLREAAAAGQDVSKIAKSVNDSLRLNRQILAEAAGGSDDALSLSLESASQSLLAAKVDIEEFLNPQDLEDAINNDLNDEIASAVLGVSTRAEKIDKKIEKLQKKASRAAELENKKMASEEARLKRTEKKELQKKRKEVLERKKKLLEERKKKLEEAREALKKAREAAKKIREAKEAEDKLNDDVEEDDGDNNDSVSNSGSDSSNSGSGKSESKDN